MYDPRSGRPGGLPFGEEGAVESANADGDDVRLRPAESFAPKRYARPRLTLARRKTSHLWTLHFGYGGGQAVEGSCDYYCCCCSDGCCCCCCCCCHNEQSVPSSARVALIQASFVNCLLFRPQLSLSQTSRPLRSSASPFPTAKSI